MISEKSIDNNQRATVICQEMTLPVMETFFTLQGEGFYQGTAAYFIRLGGCDVGCFWCDVKESWDVSAHPVKSVEEIVEEVNSQWLMVNSQRPLLNSQPSTVSIKQTTNYKPKAENHKPIVVITGGEPLLHNLNTLTESFQKKGFKTHIETSGSSTLSGSWNWICLSPKKFKPPLPEVFFAANELKIIIYNKSDFKWAEENASQVSADCKLYLQPEWSKRDEISPSIINYIQANPKWQLSLQVHKYINIP